MTLVPRPHSPVGAGNTVSDCTDTNPSSSPTVSPTAEKKSYRRPEIQLLNIYFLYFFPHLLLEMTPAG